MNTALPVTYASSLGHATEVDFYRNPTELFRWLNYRRWEGAQKRAESCPEEVSTWIVSTDPNTNAIQWRHLPLHLCCMQSQIPYSLLETLLRLYPEATEMQDHDGRTPLHMACLKAGITESVAMLLLSYNAGAAVTTDRNNNTPLDLLQQSMATLPGNVDLNSPAKVLQRMEHFLTLIKQNVRNEEIKRVDQLHASVASERTASQQIINRLEDELTNCKRTLIGLESDINAKDDLEGNFEQKLLMMTKENNQAREENKKLRQTIKEMKDTIEKEKVQIDRHDEIVNRVRNEYQIKIDELDGKMKTSQAETATTKSMLDAVESQLRVKFSSEHAQIQRVADLDNTLSEAIASRNLIESEMKHIIDNLQRENARLKECTEKTATYNVALQDKVKQLNESLSNIIAYQSILSTEQERSMEAAEMYARETLEVVNAERDRLIQFVETQRRQNEHIFTEQLKVLETGANTGLQPRAAFEAERERSFATMQQMKQHFKELEVAEANRKQQELALWSTPKTSLSHLSVNVSPTVISAASMRSPQDSNSNNNGFNVPRGGISPTAMNYAPSAVRVVNNNNTGSARLVQNSSSHSSSNPGNLSRVLERRSIELSGSEESDTDDDDDDESNSSCDEESSSVQINEDNWGRVQNGGAASGQRSSRASNLGYGNIQANRPRNAPPAGQPLYASSLRKGPTVTESSLISNLRRGGAHFIEQRQENVSSPRRQVQYTEF